MQHVCMQREKSSKRSVAMQLVGAPGLQARLCQRVTGCLYLWGMTLTRCARPQPEQQLQALNGVQCWRAACKVMARPHCSRCGGTPVQVL